MAKRKTVYGCYICLTKSVFCCILYAMDGDRHNKPTTVNVAKICIRMQNFVTKSVEFYVFTKVVRFVSAISCDNM